jgi:hypothetical protein
MFFLAIAGYRKPQREADLAVRCFIYVLAGESGDQAQGYAELPSLGWICVLSAERSKNLPARAR